MSLTPIKNIVIVGGGAAGFFAAMACAEAAKIRGEAVSIKILESSDNILKKVKISGGGRCNVTHNCFDVRKFCENYPRGSKELISAMQRFQAQDTVEWFARRGVKLVAEPDGRMFPDTDSSQTIIDCFLSETERLGIEVLKNHSVQSVVKLRDEQDTGSEGTGIDLQTKGGFATLGRSPGEEIESPLRFKINLNEREPIFAHSVMIATGSGQAGYRFAKELGHTITGLAPSLFSFKIIDELLTDLSGLSFAQAEVNLLVEANSKKYNFKERGPILITHWGLSGPAILKISAWAAREMMSAAYMAVLQVNWLGLKSREETDALLKRIKSENLKSQVSNAYPPELAKRFWLKLLDKCEIFVLGEADGGSGASGASGGSGGSGGSGASGASGASGGSGANQYKKWADVSNKELNKMVECLYSCKLNVLGKNRYKDEFVECGGVSLKEINFKTMESKITPGLFFAGEVLDVDGITGGFNFQNAWTGGWIAGQNL